MPIGYQEAYESTKTRAKTPLWFWIGTLMFAFLAWMIVVSINNNTKENKRLIEDPMKGDVYECKTTDREYLLLKVSEVKGDTVFVLQSEYAADRLKELRKMKKEGDAIYSEESVPLLRSDLKKMLEEGRIIDADRE